MPDEGSRRYLAMVKEKYGLQPPVLNTGCGAGVEQRYYLPLYKDLPHYNLDYHEYPGVDIIADVCRMPQVSRDMYGTVLSFDSLEHIAYPHKAMKEFWRVLKPNGLLILSTVMAYAVHRWGIFQNEEGFSKSHFMDYWRFTPDGLKLLFKDAKFKLLDLRGNLKDIEEENLAELPIGEGADQASITFLYATGRKRV